jgi:hypothetical protein
MELTPAQRRLAFLATVVVLAGLGAYLLFPGLRPAGHRSAQPTVRPSPVGHSAAPTAPATAVGADGPSIAATPSGLPSGSPAVDIYQWLPFSEPSLARAAAVTQQFGAYYGTFSYKQSAAGYVARMGTLITSQLSSTLAKGYTTPGVAAQRDQQKQISAGSAVINSLRAFGPSSLTFVVTIKEAMTTKQGRSQISGQYAVTVTSSGTNWQVNDIELASAGNS